MMRGGGWLICMGSWWFLFKAMMELRSGRVRRGGGVRGGWKSL
jgi:hypothetical protein